VEATTIKDRSHQFRLITFRITSEAAECTHFDHRLLSTTILTLCLVKVFAQSHPSQFQTVGIFASLGYGPEGGMTCIFHRQPCAGTRSRSRQTTHATRFLDWMALAVLWDLAQEQCSGFGTVPQKQERIQEEKRFRSRLLVKGYRREPTLTQTQLWLSA
jgi:hypothetical protein